MEVRFGTNSIRAISHSLTCNEPARSLLWHSIYKTVQGITDLPSFLLQISLANIGLFPPCLTIGLLVFLDPSVVFFPDITNKLEVNMSTVLKLLMEMITKSRKTRLKVIINQNYFLKSSFHTTRSTHLEAFSRITCITHICHIICHHISFTKFFAIHITFPLI